MAEYEGGFCYTCKQKHGIIPVSDEAAAIIAEDATSMEEYFTMESHINPSTGKECEGSGKGPESLVEANDWFDPGDEQPPEDETEDPLSGWPDRDFPKRQRV